MAKQQAVRYYDDDRPIRNLAMERQWAREHKARQERAKKAAKARAKKK